MDRRLASVSGMSESKPSRGAKRIIDKLVVNVIDWGELNVHHNMADVSFDASAEGAGQVRPDGSMVFGTRVGRAFERAADDGHAMTPEEVAEFRDAIREVTFTALDKRIEERAAGPDGADGPGGMRIGAGDEADRFLNDGLRRTDWAVNGDRICYRVSPELGSRLRDAEPGAPVQPVAENAAFALADQYARARGDWPDLAVRDLLKAPRDQVFEKVVDAKLASQLRDHYQPMRAALSDLRARLANDVRAEFRQLADEPHLSTAQVQERVAQVCERVDDAARTVKETIGAMGTQQTGRESDAGARKGAVDRSRSGGITR